MGESPYSSTQITGDERAPFGGLGVVDVADLLLLALTRRRAAALLVVAGDATTLRYEQGDATVDLAQVESAYGDALVARLAIIAGLDVAAEREQVGRLRVAAGDAQVDLLLLVWPVAAGLSAEVRRIAGAQRTTAADAPGELARGAEFGRYRITGLLGRGGQGAVYRGEHVILEKPVAIKVLHSDAASSPALGAQFVVEARAACRARHPGIVDVTDFGVLPDGRPFYVMELIEAGTLAALLGRHGQLPVPRALAIAAQIVDALRAAASQGVVHRDLKPANIFIDDRDTVRIGDFGLALIRQGHVPQSSVDNAIVGTVHYMAPELIDGGAADVRSDIYAVGCILFEMLTGRQPFTGTTAWEILRQHAEAPVPELTGPDGPVPPAVERVVHRAMAKDPRARYQRPEELHAELVAVRRVVERAGWRRWLPP